MVHDVVVVGGFGHVGLPLALALADKGSRVCAVDIDEEALSILREGEMPFVEHGAEEVLERVLRNGSLTLSMDPSVISTTRTIVIVIGTPVDRHLNPGFDDLRAVVQGYLPHLRAGQLIVLRSTIYPGTSEKLHNWIREQGKDIEVAFCPERIAQGLAMKELETLPQIVSAFSEQGVRRASQLFAALTKEIVVVPPIEAELAKLFSNVWRYLKFAAANQFFMIANDHGADFYRIHRAMTTHYERCQDLPKPGFAAGPCLFKDAMQLAAFNNNSFYLGHAAMLVNEGLPNYVVNMIKRKHDISRKTVGILGMAFKADVDDKRSSLSYKLKKILTFESRKVICSDVYIQDEGFVTAEELIRESDLILVGTPHRQYRELRFPPGKIVVDVWNLSGKGCVI
jgi:UDP-N-acetyl-D-mannosaminuronic acid dehydrogenase